MASISNVCQRYSIFRLPSFHVFDVKHPVYFQYHGLKGVLLEMTHNIWPGARVYCWLCGFASVDSTDENVLGYDGKATKYDHFHFGLVNGNGELRPCYFRWLTVHQQPHFCINKNLISFVF